MFFFISDLKKHQLKNGKKLTCDISRGKSLTKLFTIFRVTRLMSNNFLRKSVYDIFNSKLVNHEISNVG